MLKSVNLSNLSICSLIVFALILVCFSNFNEKAIANSASAVTFDNVSASSITSKTIKTHSLFVESSDKKSSISLICAGGNPYIFLSKKRSDGRFVNSSVYVDNDRFVVGGNLQSGPNGSYDASSSYRFSISQDLKEPNVTRLQIIDKDGKIQSITLDVERIKTLLDTPSED